MREYKSSINELFQSIEIDIIMTNGKFFIWIEQKSSVDAIE
jgi:hypothetical protein